MTSMSSPNPHSKGRADVGLPELASIATAFRAAIKATLPEAKLLSMAAFPRGSCGDASALLGAWLADLGIGGFEYVCGERGGKDDGSWTTHAWLVRGELVVDITADQFLDAPAAVIVAEPSAWHRAFTVGGAHPSDFRAAESSQNGALQAMYEKVTDRLRVG